MEPRGVRLRLTTSPRAAAPRLDELLAYAKANPGRVTYPAPPDFTGSAFVRQVVAAKGEDAAFAYLQELEPHLYREGRSYPKSAAELDDLFANGQVDFAMSYEAGFVRNEVRKGAFPDRARPFVLERRLAAERLLRDHPGQRRPPRRRAGRRQPPAQPRAAGRQGRSGRARHPERARPGDAFRPPAPRRCGPPPRARTC